jgi:hypothetical protein
MEGCRWEGQNLQLKEVQRLMKKKMESSSITVKDSNFATAVYLNTIN